MQVQNFSNLNFYSRNKEIRFADDIARKVNKCYPRVSSSKVICWKNSENYPNLIESLVLKTVYSMRFMRDELYDNAQSFHEAIFAFIEPIKKYKIGNCGESAHLSAIFAKINNIKNAHLANLVNSEGKSLDHFVLYVNNKKPYVIDSWLGFADYVPNALNRYKNEYKQYFDIENNETITFATRFDDEYTDFFKNDFSKKQIKEILKKLPDIKL